MSIMFSLVDFISYWYMRYLLVSELYLVEKWERRMIHVLLLMLFVGLWCLNKMLINFLSNNMSSLINT